jgi:nucleoside-diphosphate-sugar epimerase
VSSLSVLDWGALDGALVTEDAPLEPRPEARGWYTRSKLLAEQHVRTAARDQGLPAVIIRPGILVGPEGPGLDALNAVVMGRQLVLLGDDGGAPPLISVHDAADLIVRAGCDPALEPGTVFHAVRSQTTTARTLATRLARERGLRLRRIPRPLLQAGAAAAWVVARALGRESPITPYRMRAAGARLRFDCTRARTALGWADHPSPLDQAGTPAAVA